MADLSAILDDAGAVAALIAIGLPQNLAASMVLHWKQEKAAKLVDVYGVHTTREHAIDLRERVAAIKEQFLKKLISADTVNTSLQSYGLPVLNRRALISLWEAQSRKTVIPP